MCVYMQYMCHVLSQLLMTWWLGILIAGLEESVNNRDSTYGKPSYFDIVRAEYVACRETVCLVDMSTFAKVEIKVCWIRGNYFARHKTPTLIIV